MIGHLVAHRGGHALHTAFAAKILEETDAWRLVDATADGLVGCRGRAGAAAPRQGRTARLANSASASHFAGLAAESIAS